jgi:hypothetical protein
LREQATSAVEPPPYIHLAPLVYAGLWGVDAGPLALAATTALFFAGVSLLDDLAGGDLPACLASYRPAKITLTAATLLCSLPQLAIAELEAPSPVLAAMHRTLAAGPLAMSAGQGYDLALAGTAGPEPEAADASAASKSGEQLALFAVLGAQLTWPTILPSRSLPSPCRLRVSAVNVALSSRPPMAPRRPRA